MDIQSIAKSLGLDKIDAGNLGMSQDQMKGEADRMWRMLDEMSESDPEAYKKFIAGQMEQNKPLTEQVKAHSLKSAGAVEVKPVPGFVFVTGVSGEDRFKQPLFLNYVHSKDVDPPLFVKGAPSLEQELHRTRVPLWLSKKLPLPKGGHFIDVLVHTDNITRAASQPEYRLYLVELGIVAAEQEFKFVISRDVKPVGNTYVGASASGPAPFIVRLAAADAAAAAASKAGDAQLMQSIASDKASSTSDITLEQLLAARRNGATGSNDSHTLRPAAAAPTATVSSRPLIQEISSTPAVATPSHSLKRLLGDSAGSKKSLVLEVMLPGVSSMQTVELDVTSSGVSLYVPGKYELAVVLPEPVDADSVSAKFNKGSSSVTVTLPCAC